MNKPAQNNSLSWLPMTAPAPTNTASTALLGAAPDAPAPTPAPSQPTADLFNAWRAGFRIADGVAGAINDLVNSGKIPIPAKFIPVMDSVLFGLNKSFVQVDTAFYEYLKNPDTNPFVLGPAPIVSWPDTTKPGGNLLNMFKDALDVLSGILEAQAQKIKADLDNHPEMPIALDALTTLINSGDDTMMAISNVVDPTPPAPAPAAS